MIYPHLDMPADGVPFDFSGVLATPAAPSGDTVVLQFTVPSGFNGVIKDLSHNVTGGGFVQGSGDIVWRLSIDGRWVRNYGNLTVEFGRIDQPRATYGILLRSGQVFRYIVSNFGYTVPSSSIVVFARGWYWPMEVS